MSFKLTNASNNPLTLSDGKILPVYANRTVEEITDRERKYQKHGWLQIEKVEAPKEAPKAAADEIVEVPKTAAEETGEVPKQSTDAPAADSTASEDSPKETKKAGDAGKKGGK